MSKSVKRIILSESLQNIVGGTRENKVCYWIKIWVDSKSKTRLRSIISEFPKEIKPLPYSEGIYEIRFTGPYKTREDAISSLI